MNSPITFQITDRFFDRDLVIRKIGRENAKFLGRAGAFIRQRARTQTLRRRKAISQPGSPPSIRSKNPTRSLKLIFFAIDSNWEEVVIGPVKLNGSAGMIDRRFTVPELLEKGGSVSVMEESWDAKQWHRMYGHSRKPGKHYRKRTLNYRARPYMAPTLEKEARAGTLLGLYSWSQ